MLKVFHCSDLHIDARGRMEDLRRCLDAFLSDCSKGGADLIVCSGDYFERRSVAAERTFLADFLQRATEIAPFYGARGNHDVPGDLEVFNRLETRHSIRIEERVTAEPGSAWMVETRGGLRVGCLGMGWIEKCHFVAGMETTVDGEATRQMTIAAVRDLLTCLRAEATRVRRVGAVPILVTHVMLGGSVVSSGQILIGQGIELAPSDLADVGAAYVACGHIHVAQGWFGDRVAYSGNPTRHDFGEAREPKGYRLVTLTDEGEFVSSEFRELPARRMVLLEVDWTDAGSLALPEHDDLTGALVRFRYRVNASDLHQVDEEAMTRYLRNQGAEEIRLEAIVEARARERSSEIRTAQTSEEKLRAYCVAKGLTHDEGSWARIVAKLGDLEARV